MAFRRLSYRLELDSLLDTTRGGNKNRLSFPGSEKLESSYSIYYNGRSFLKKALKMLCYGDVVILQTSLHIVKVTQF